MRAALLVALMVLASGCILAEEGRFPPHNQSKTQEYPNFENLVISGTLTGGGDEVRIGAVAHNQGPHTYKVSSICAPSWSESMTGRFGQVNHKEPMAVCEAFGLKDFKPGEKIPFTTQWDGNLWDSQAGTYEPAPAGNYTWHVFFEVYKGGSGTEYESREQIPLRFDVTVRG